MASELLDGKAPATVLPAPQLFEDLEMLYVIFSEDTPTKFPVRCRASVTMFYGFGDASGQRFGSIV